MSGGRHVGPERRTVLRPRPEHVRELAADLREAETLLESAHQIDVLAGLATVRLVGNALNNLAGAMSGSSR